MKSFFSNYYNNSNNKDNKNKLFLFVGLILVFAVILFGHGDVAHAQSIDTTVEILPSINDDSTIDYSSSVLTVTEGESLIVKFQYDESLQKTKWQCFSVTDSEGNKIKKNADITFWNDRNLFSYDGIQWGGNSYNDKVFYGTCKYITGDSIWIKVTTFLDYDKTEGDEVYYLNVNGNGNTAEFKPRIIPLTIKDSDSTPPVASVDYSSSRLQVIEGQEPFVVKFQYSDSLTRNGWQCFSVTDNDGNKVKRNSDLKLWNDRSQYSYDGVNWGGNSYNDKVFYGTCKYLTGDELWISIPTFADYDSTEGDETYYLNVVNNGNKIPQFQQTQIPLTITESGRTVPVATVDDNSSVLTVTEGESLIVKFQYSDSLLKNGWQCFDVTNSDGDKVKRNSDVRFWNDRNLFSYDGVNWGGNSYNDKVFYGVCKYLTGDQLWIKIPTFTDDIIEGDEIYYLTARNDKIPHFEPRQIELTIQDGEN